MKIFLSKRDNETRVMLINKIENESQVQFLNGTKKGETITYSESTMKRWWKEIEEDITIKENLTRKKLKEKQLIVRK